MYEYYKEAAKWFEYYLNYNDVNISHAESAFISNGFHLEENLEKLKQSNREFEDQIKKMGYAI